LRSPGSKTSDDFEIGAEINPKNADLITRGIEDFDYRSEQ